MIKEYNPVLLSKDRYYRDRSAEKVNKSSNWSQCIIQSEYIWKSTYFSRGCDYLCVLLHHGIEIECT